MRDTCTITRHAGGEWDSATGTYADAAPTVIYQGKCRLRNSMANPQMADAGEAEWAADLIYIHLPVGTSTGVADGDLVTITASVFDPALVGLRATVVGGHGQSMSTARRLPCRVVTRDG